MNRLLTAVIAAGGSLALAGGVLVTTAMPAAATGSPGGNSSYGASAPAGTVTAVPQALAQQTGPEFQFVSNVDISGLLSTGRTLDTASTLAAFSRVASVNAGFSAAGQTVSLVARQVESTCRSNPQTASANLIGGVLTVNGTAISLPNHPTPGETLTLGGVTVILNNQLTVTGSSIEDQAVELQVGGRTDRRAGGPSVAQYLYIGVSVCNNPGSGSNTIAVTNPGTQTNNSGSAITPLPISATDSDTSQILTYSATGLPSALAIDPTTGVISGTPAHAGTFSVTVTATDTTGASGTSTSFTWTINNVVSVTSPGPLTNTQGVPLSTRPLAVTDSDPSLTTFTWSASGLPAGLSIDPGNGVISGTPTTDGTFTVTVTATDSASQAGSCTFSWTIVS